MDSLSCAVQSVSIQGNWSICGASLPRSSFEVLWRARFSSVSGPWDVNNNFGGCTQSKNTYINKSQLDWAWQRTTIESECFSVFSLSIPLYRHTRKYDDECCWWVALHRRVYTQKLLRTDAFTHTGAFTQRSFYTERLLDTEAFTHRGFYTEKPLHRGAFRHKGVYTQKLLHTDAVTQRSLYTESFYTRKLSHTDVFTQRSLYTEKPLHRGAFTRSGKVKLAAILQEKPFAGAFGNKPSPTCSKQKTAVPW